MRKSHHQKTINKKKHILSNNQHQDMMWISQERGPSSKHGYHIDVIIILIRTELNSKTDYLQSLYQNGAPKNLAPNLWIESYLKQCINIFAR